MLVEVTTVEQLIERLRKGKYKTGNEILTKSKWVPYDYLSLTHKMGYSDSVGVGGRGHCCRSSENVTEVSSMSQRLLPILLLALLYQQLSYMRIATPCRSTHCVHSQCFDAFSWYSVMEQTTTWLCPVCEKVLNTEDLIVDG